MPLVILAFLSECSLLFVTQSRASVRVTVTVREASKSASTPPSPPSFMSWAACLLNTSSYSPFPSKPLSLFTCRSKWAPDWSPQFQVLALLFIIRISFHVNFKDAVMTSSIPA